MRGSREVIMEGKDGLTLEQKLAQKEKELEIILAIDRIRDVTVESHSMLSAIINVVAEELEAGLGLVSLVDEETGTVELKAIDDRMGVFRRLERTMVERLMERATALEGVSSMESLPELQMQGLSHLLAAPLTIGGQRLGALVLLKEGDGFSQADVDLLEAVVSQADSAVVQARTYQRLQQRNRELEAIYQVDRIRDATTDTRELLSSIANVVTSSLGADLCLMSLVDGSTFDLGRRAIRFTVAAKRSSALWASRGRAAGSGGQPG
jgi:nitrate/nitrite-specific signal transduction histidine kinase